MLLLYRAPWGALLESSLCWSSRAAISAVHCASWEPQHLIWCTVTHHPSCWSLQAYSQRSDHLALIAAFNGWSGARAAGGRLTGAEFARQYSLSEQVREECWQRTIPETALSQ